MRLPNESISQFAIRVAWETGHFWSPANPEGQDVKQEDLKLLKPEDPVVVAAMISMTKMDATRFTKHVLDQHGRAPAFDGQLGPATVAMALEANCRCPIPDFAPPAGTSFLFYDPNLQAVVERMQRQASQPAFGQGNWKGCHEIGSYHCATVGVNTSGLPSFLKPLFLQVLKNVQAAYAGVGLLFRFIKDGADMITGESFAGNINTEMSFVGSSDGWIGLAIVGTGETCGGKIWCKFLNTYRGGSDDASILTQWTTLLKHELGHNCGRSHTNGGVMNPSIVNGLPVEWGSNDPSTGWLKGQFGGVPVPIPGVVVPPVPPNAPVPGGSEWQKQIRDLQVNDAVQNATLQWLVNKVKAFLILISLLVCSPADAQVVSGDGQSIVISSNAPSIPVVTAPAVKSPDPVSQPTVIVPDAEAPKPKVSKRYLAMFTASFCGPCQTWKRNTKPQLESTGYAVREIEMTNKANVTKFGKRISRFPAFVVVDWNTGTWLSEPVVGGIDLATAKWMLDGPGLIQPQQARSAELAPPVRYIQWPGWGTIDLETYNRNCNCGMCNSIRGMQVNYRNQLRAYQQQSTSSSTQPVTPDQEGTPHALVETMLDSMELRSSDVLGELGCGDGRVLIAAAKRGIRGIGVELDPARAQVARRNVKAAGLDHLITIEVGDVQNFDMQRVTVATAYLYPPLLAKLAPKLKRARVVASPYHEIPGLAMAKVGEVWIYRR